MGAVAESDGALGERVAVRGALALRSRSGPGAARPGLFGRALLLKCTTPSLSSTSRGRAAHILPVVCYFICEAFAWDYKSSTE